MRKLRSILSTLGVVGLTCCFSVAYAQEWGAAPSPYETPTYYPVSNYSANVSVDGLASDIEYLKKELAKKSDKPDPKKGFTAPRIGGRVFIDSVNILNQSSDGLPVPLSDTNPGYDGRNFWGFREARLAATGTAYDFLDYKLELGFEGTSADAINFKDVFLGIKSVPLFGYVRIGNQYVEDGGSEICNGSTNYTFMEMPAPTGGQFTSRRLGISSRHLFANDRGRLFLGAYGARSVADTRQQRFDNQGYMLNARLTHAPLFKNEGKQMFLYGGYYNFTDPSGSGPQGYIRVRPGGYNLDMDNAFGAGSSIPTTGVHKAGFETVYQNGAFCLQTDFYLKHFSDAVVGAKTDDATLYGGFVMGRYFLTRGAYRKYSLESAAWSSVAVNCPVLLSERGAYNFIQGSGVWEVAAYYGFLNNDDFKEIVPYGTDHEIGVALNWYWNPQLKWALNYVHQVVDITTTDGKARPNTDVLGVSCRFHW